MTDQWKYQLRVTLNDAFAETARSNPSDPAIASLQSVLAKHDAALKCQYDAFAGYVVEAEQFGTDKYHLYEWTKATIENPVKRAKYLTSFTIYVGGEEVYEREKAEPLEADLAGLVGGEIVQSMAKHDTNPANNPQMPAKYRKQG